MLAIRVASELGRLQAALTDRLSRLDREDGQAMVEYALILALISIVTIAVLRAVGVSVNSLFGRVDSALSAAQT
jgi:pilus assembly protein Flp/PilA